MKKLGFISVILMLAAVLVCLGGGTAVAGSLSPGSVVFYGSMTETAPADAEVTNNFDQAETKYIFADFPVTPGKDMANQSSAFKAVWYDPDGNVFVQSEGTIVWKNFMDGVTWTVSASTDKWVVGEYKVQFLIDGTVFATETFQVNKSFFTLNAKVSNIRFYESSKDELPEDKRVYTYTFDSAKTRYVTWVLDMTHPAPDERVNFTVHIDFYTANGKLFAQHDCASNVDPGWTDSMHESGWGSIVPGKAWPPGVYKAVFSVDGTTIGSKSFTVTKPAPPKPPKKAPKVKAKKKK